MWHRYLFLTLFLSTSIYALWRGGAAERLGVANVILGSVLTILTYSVSFVRFRNVEIGVMIADGVVFAGFLALMICSTRSWPAWVTGLQFVALVVHLLKAISPAPFAFPYATVLAMWGYPIQIILALASFRHRQRLMRFGEDSSWPAFSSRWMRRPPNSPTA